MTALLTRRQDAADAALVMAAAVGFAGLLQLLTLRAQAAKKLAAPLKVSFDAPMRGFFVKGWPAWWRIPDRNC